MTAVRNPDSRQGELGELRAAVDALPRGARGFLASGPHAEPRCGVCSSLAHLPADDPHVEQLLDYHDIGVLDLAELLGEDDLETVAALTSDAAEMIKALSGALSAERCLAIYLLAGWIPPRVAHAQHEVVS